MSDEHYALSPAPLQPPPPTEADYEAIFAAVMETVRGRWFLSEFGRRNRQADTQIVLGAIERLEAMVRGERTDPSFERIRSDIRDMADAIAATRREIAAIRHDDDHKGIGEATEELDAIVMATERATSDILAAAETIQETAWTLREQGLDGQSCDKLDRCATEVYLACSFQDLTGQRTRKVIHVLRFLEGRINAMVEILGDDGRPKDEPTRARAPLDIDMDQAEIDAVIPTTHATRGPPMAEPADPTTQDSDPALMASMPAAEPVQLHAAFDYQPEALPEVSPVAAAMDAGEPASGMADGASLDDVDLIFDAPPETQALDAPPDTGLTEAMAVDVIQAETAPQAGQTASGEDLAAKPPAGAGAMETTPVDAEPPVWAQNVAPDTKTLMADLLAIIRPDGTSETAADAPGSVAGDALLAAAEALAAGAAEPAPRREDFRLMHPIAPGALSSDFVIVPLTLDASDVVADTPVTVDAAATIGVAEPEPEAFAPPATDDTAAVEQESAAVVAEPPPDAEALRPALSAAGDALTGEAEAAPSSVIDVVDLDNDLLMAAEALAPRRGPVVDIPAVATASDDPIAASPGSDEIAGFEADLLVPAEAAAPFAPPAEVDAEANDAAATDDEAIPANSLPMPSPVPAVAGDPDDGDDDAAPSDFAAHGPTRPLAAEERSFSEPAAPPPAVWSQPQLTASATAALAALAMPASPTMTAEASADTGHDEVVGHADPLAAVNALSVEERIALFS